MQRQNKKTRMLKGQVADTHPCLQRQLPIKQGCFIGFCRHRRHHCPPLVLTWVSWDESSAESKGVVGAQCASRASDVAGFADIIAAIVVYPAGMKSTRILAQSLTHSLSLSLSLCTPPL